MSASRTVDSAASSRRWAGKGNTMGGFYGRFGPPVKESWAGRERAAGNYCRTVSPAFAPQVTQGDASRREIDRLPQLAAWQARQRSLPAFPAGPRLEGDEELLPASSGSRRGRR